MKPFKGILCVYLLDMEPLVMRRLSDLKRMNFRVVAFGLYMPVIGAAAGLAVAIPLRLSARGAMLLAVLGWSASYIVVPAVMRAALPNASPAIALGACGDYIDCHNSATVTTAVSAFLALMSTVWISGAIAF